MADQKMRLTQMVKAAGEGFQIRGPYHDFRKFT